MKIVAALDLFRVTGAALKPLEKEKTMRYSHGIFACLTAIGVLTSSAHAQSMPGMGSAENAMGGMSSGGMGSGMGSGMMSGMLPNVSSASSGNIAGVLSYCVQNNYLSGSGATSALSGLTSKAGLTSSSDYTSGQKGQLLTGESNPFSLSTLKSGLKQKVCNMVLSRAQNLL
ncbi:YjjA family protein [Acetobacter garciniae]|uniref:YjjA family protein n=1 Tax=Acetobacter garciniae TaxID=2817435 RepID=UPI002ED989B8